MPSGWYSLAIACATFGSYEISKVTSRKDFLCLGEHEFHRTEGRASQKHEFLSSGWYSCNSYAISKATPRKDSCYSCNSCSLK